MRFLCPIFFVEDFEDDDSFGGGGVVSFGGSGMAGCCFFRVQDRVTRCSVSSPKAG